MGAAQLLVPFLVTWFCIHTFLFLLQRFLNRPNLPVGPGSGPDYELLPTTISSSSISIGGQSSPGTASKQEQSSSNTSVSGLLVKPFHVRFSTTGLNSFFFRLGNSPKLIRFWRVWYGLGVGFAMLAMVLGWGLLMYAAIKLIALAVSFLLTLSPIGSTSIWGSVSDQQKQHHLGSGKEQSVSYNRFRKRDLDDGSGAALGASGSASDSSESNMVFHPVIPGVTLPMSHLPYYLIALLVSGVFHEAGHAIAAARERTQVSSIGIFLYILYPGAFVDISPRALAIMSPLQQLRVICAGVWHNAVLFFAASIFLWSGALQLSFRMVGWTHMNDGLSVVEIASPSPLYDVLKTGSIITKVDDISLRGDPLGIWTKTLLPSTNAEAIIEQEVGFCIPISLLFVKPSDCCLFTPDMQFGHSSDRSLSCFTPFDPSSKTSAAIPSGSGDRILAKNGQCLPSFDILARANPVRCTPQQPSCENGNSCYRPFAAYRTGSMVRLHYKTPSWMAQLSETPSEEMATESETHGQDEERVVLYQGDPKDIWEAVQVTTMGSRWSFLPLWLPNAILLTIRYTISFSLALSVLNIVPARHLDGHHALKAAAALVYSIRQSYKSTQSLRDSLIECLGDGGSSMVAGSSNISTASFPKGSRIVKGIIISTTVLLGWVMVGSLIQMVVEFLWK